MVFQPCSFSISVNEADASKLCDSMKEELLNILTQREMECIQSNLQQVDTKKKRDFVYEEKDKMLQNMQVSVVIQQPLGNFNKHFLI